MLEIVIVLGILGILAAIALPSYQKQMRKGNRAAAQAFLADVANKEQIYLQTARAYGTLTDLGVTAPAEVTRHYNVVVTPTAAAANTLPGYTARATPSSTTQTPDGWIQIDQDGNKTSQYPTIATW
jgi:type IV pilus assembly protein PilE